MNSNIDIVDQISTRLQNYANEWAQTTVRIGNIAECDDQKMFNRLSKQEVNDLVMMVGRYQIPRVLEALTAVASKAHTEFFCTSTLHGHSGSHYYPILCQFLAALTERKKTYPEENKQAVYANMRRLQDLVRTACDDQRSELSNADLVEIETKIKELEKLYAKLSDTGAKSLQPS